MREIGAHVSIAGGIDQAVVRAKELGCNSLQLFSGSPRIWAKVDLAAHDTDKYYSEREKKGVKSVFTHASYLVNLASDNPNLVAKSARTIKYDLQFDALVKGSGVIVHLGSHQGRGWAAVKEQVVEQLRAILADAPQEATLLIENSAGQNGKLCSDLAEIKWLLEQVDSPQLGWCFDTCHGFAAGYDLGAEVTAAEAVHARNQRAETAAAAISRLELWPQLKCIHVNDSRGDFGSGIDKHANLGEGKILRVDWEYFLNLTEVKKLPLILEVPGFAGTGPDQENVEILKELVGEGGAKSENGEASAKNKAGASSENGEAAK